MWGSSDKLASDAVRWQEDKYAVQQQQTLSTVMKWYRYLSNITFCSLQYIMKGDTKKLRPGCHYS